MNLKSLFCAFLITIPISHLFGGDSNGKVVYENNFVFNPVMYDDWVVGGGNFVWISGQSPYVKLQTTESDGQGKLSYQIGNLKANQDYSISVDTDFYGDKVAPSYVRLGVRILDANGSTLAEEYRTAEDNSAEYKPLSLTFRSKEDSSVTVQLLGTEKHWEPEAYFKNFVVSEYFGGKSVVKLSDRFDTNPLDTGWNYIQGRASWRNKESLVLAPVKREDGSSEQAIAEITLFGYSRNTEYVVEVDTDFYGEQVYPSYCSVSLEVIGRNSQQVLAAVDRKGGNGTETISVGFNSGANTEIAIRLNSTKDYWNPEAYFDNFIVKQL